MPSAEHTALFKVLLKTLREQTEALGHHFTDQQLSNLTFAFRKVLPKTPDELSVVIALGLQQKPTQAVVKEYLRRKNDTVFYPYHKLRHAQKVLEKTWGVLLYEEQAKPLLEELTGRIYGNLPATIFLDIDVLTECLKKDYQGRLSEKEIEKIHKDLRLYTKIGFNSYAWCLDVAERVLKAAKEDKN